MAAFEWLVVFIGAAVISPLCTEITKDLYQAAKRRMGLSKNDPDDIDPI